MVKTPIVINDVTKGIVNPRFELSKEGDNMKPFVFTDFALDKRRKLELINQTSEIYKNKTKSGYCHDKKNLKNNQYVNLVDQRKNYSETKEKYNKIDDKVPVSFNSIINNKKGKTFYADRRLYDSDSDDPSGAQKMRKYKTQRKLKNYLGIFYLSNNQIS
jgi:hypothetical protein